MNPIESNPAHFHLSNSLNFWACYCSNYLIQSARLSTTKFLHELKYRHVASLIRSQSVTDTYRSSAQLLASILNEASVRCRFEAILIFRKWVAWPSCLNASSVSSGELRMAISVSFVNKQHAYFNQNTNKAIRYIFQDQHQIMNDICLCVFFIL